MEITLKFNKDNNFCPVCEKYGKQDEPIEIGKMVAWLINNAEASIAESYKVDAPRRIEMERLCANLREQLISQLTPEDVEELKINVQPLILGS